MTNIRPVPQDVAEQVFGQWLGQVEVFERSNTMHRLGGYPTPLQRVWNPVVDLRRADQRWTKSEDETALKMWVEGRSLSAIADKLGRSINAVKQRVDDLRWELAEPKR